MTSGESTVFHITHWKAGSQWIRAVFNRVAPERLANTKPDMSNVCDDQLRPGAIYSPVYMPTHWFDEQVTPQEHHRYIVIIRDLRDTAVSWYFSMKHSHGKVEDKSSDELILDYRQRFQDMSVQDGLAVVIEERMNPMANIQLSWEKTMRERRLFMRYEDLIADEHAAFNRMFDFAGVRAGEAERKRAIDGESFSRRSGRSRGEEDVSSHYRKGVSGDWQNHFDDRLREMFKEKFGQALITTGYEADLNW